MRRVLHRWYVEHEEGGRRTGQWGHVWLSRTYEQRATPLSLRAWAASERCRPPTASHVNPGSVRPTTATARGRTDRMPNKMTDAPMTKSAILGLAYLLFGPPRLLLDQLGDALRRRHPDRRR